MRTLVVCAAAAAALATAAAGCKSTAPGAGAGAAPASLTCDGNPDPHCDNPVNRVLVPLLRAANMPLRDATPQEFCRRAYVDLVGRIPTATELAGCVTQKPGDAVDTLMAQPDYPIVQARSWGQTFGYDLNGGKNWYLNIYDLDAIVRSAYTLPNPLAYSDLVSKVVLHPAFYSNHQNDDWTKAIWTDFLGRTARLDEVEIFRPLTQIWNYRLFCDGTLWWEVWKAFPDDGTVASFCDINNGFPMYEWGADFCNCDPSQTPLGCASNALGQPVDFGSDGCIDVNNPGDPVNLVRLTTHPAGAHTTCPDGTMLPESVCPLEPSGQDPTCCTDSLLDANTGAYLGPIPIAPLPSATQAAHLQQLGQALAARADFWEAGANNEIKRFIGWWQTGTRKPDYDVPDVRTVLAAQLQSTGSLPAIEKLLLTSLLYDAPADAPNGATGDTTNNPPLYSMGPSKFLGSEMWFDSAAVATMDTVVGYCDYRFLYGGYPGLEDGSHFDNTYGCFVDAKLVTRLPAPLASQGIDANAYYQLGPGLGGCNPEVARPTASTVGVVYAQHNLAIDLCAYGSQVLPPGFDSSDASDASLGAAATWMANRGWSREPTSAEVSSLVADMKQCLAAGSGGCSSPEAAARWSCARILDSAEFAVY